MIRVRLRTVGIAIAAACVLFPTAVSRLTVPANYGGHDLTTGFGRGRLDLQGIVSEGRGGSIDLPAEPLTLTLRLSGDGPIHLSGAFEDKLVVGSATPINVQLNLPRGGRVAVESAARIRIHEFTIERTEPAPILVGCVALLGFLGVWLSARRVGPIPALAALVVAASLVFATESLSRTFAQVTLARLLPAVLVLTILTPLALALWQARFLSRLDFSRLSLIAFASSLLLSTIQLVAFEQPLPLGDPGAYFEMGGRFADALSRLGSPLGLGPILSDVQPYLALPATGVLYGLLRLLGGLGVIYAAQALAMAAAVSTLVAICETEFGPRIAKIALGVSLLHPSFSILPGIVQPEPFILLAWTMAALLTLRAMRTGGDPRALLGSGVLLGAGLGLHPQGLSFLLLALVLCLTPWVKTLLPRPAVVIVPMLGAASVLLPIAAAEHFSKPLAYVLDRQFGFFAYTSPHPLGFWLYVDSDGWQGPLRIEDTTYQKELIAMKGETAVRSTFADVAAFVARHPAESAQTVLRNLHRLWHQPDNPFSVPFVLPYSLQVPLHRGLIVLFVLSLPLLLSGRAAILALPFVMLSMTYPAYHIFNKYATPALPFVVIGAAVTLGQLWDQRGRVRSLLAVLAAAGVASLLPAVWVARLGIPGDVFLALVRGLFWVGITVAVVIAARSWGDDRRARFLSALIGLVVLVGSSRAASLSDTTRGAWSVSLATPFEASCRIEGPTESTDPAWLFVDAEAVDGTPPRVEINGRALDPMTPTMPTFGLATTRGRRDPATLRQMWRAPVSEAILAEHDLTIRVIGDSSTRVFGDIREGGSGPRLSLGNWPYLSVYRLMHEGQYRLPTRTAPAQACIAKGLSGRPGVAVARIAPGEESRIALKAAKPLLWIF